MGPRSEPRERIRRLKRTATTALAVGSAAAVVFVAQGGATGSTAVTQNARSAKAGTARGFYVVEGAVMLAATDEAPVMRADG